MHRHGAKLFVQLHHPGKETSSRLLGGVQPVSASVLPNSKGEMPRALSTEEVQELVRKFVSGAMIASTAGVDGVEIHAAHSYLVNQFLSPKYNQRSDAYGGSPEKRIDHRRPYCCGGGGCGGGGWPWAGSGTVT